MSIQKQMAALSDCVLPTLLCNITKKTALIGTDVIRPTSSFVGQSDDDERGIW